MAMNDAEKKRLKEFKTELNGAVSSAITMRTKVKGVLKKGDTTSLAKLAEAAKTAKKQDDVFAIERDLRALQILEKHVETFVKEGMSLHGNEELPKKYDTLAAVGKAHSKVIVSGDALFGSVDQFKTAEDFYKMRGAYANASMISIGQKMIEFGGHYGKVRKLVP